MDERDRTDAVAHVRHVQCSGVLSGLAGAADHGASLLRMLSAACVLLLLLWASHPPSLRMSSLVHRRINEPLPSGKDVAVWRPTSPQACHARTDRRDRVGKSSIERPSLAPPTAGGCQASHRPEGRRRSVGGATCRPRGAGSGGNGRGADRSPGEQAGCSGTGLRGLSGSRPIEQRSTPL